MMTTTGLRTWLGGAVVGATLAAAAPADARPIEDEIIVDRAVVVGRVGRSGRSPVQVDAVQRRLVEGDWSPPSAGDELEVAGGDVRTWTELAADEGGWITGDGLRGGYASCTVELDADAIMILEATGHSAVYVNGEPRVGDPYRTGWCRIPVALRAGVNELLFAAGRGGVKARLVAPAAAAMLNLRDTTLPDVIPGDRDGELVAGIIVLNATESPADGLRVWSQGPNVSTTATPVPTIPPLGMRKVPVLIDVRRGLAADAEAVEVTLRLTGGAAGTAGAAGGAELDEQSITLGVRGPAANQRRTFVSHIDGSVQYFGLRPAADADDGTTPGIILTLHGAGVDAIGQSACYAPKPWAHVVAPTNRRPFGFDWEDWGRLDAIEVLERAGVELEHDPAAVYLTGHSMGGHGAWHVGATFPDRFAAIAPSAGWISFWSYTGAPRPEPDDDVRRILRRATNASDTLALSRNYLHHGIYVLHGDRDDNVPVTQARMMREHLAEFHPDFAYYERPGAGHWWGNQCLDWEPLTAFLERRTRPSLDAVDHVEFHTANPGVSARSRWATIAAQQVPMAISSIDLTLDRATGRFAGTTDNVTTLVLDVVHLEGDGPIAVELDGQVIEDVARPASERLVLVRRDDAWSIDDDALDPARKNPARSGPFKDAFRNRVLLVHGTGGDAVDTNLARVKARYDAETFWYRGNGALEVMSDVAFLADPGSLDRNVVLYGNADTNRAWSALLAESPVQVHDGVVRIGDRRIEGDDLACLMIRPRRGSDVASVGVVAATGPRGMRLTQRLPYFVSGVAYPDCVVMGVDVLERGDEGVRAAGFFGNDWRIETGDFAHRP